MSKTNGKRNGKANGKADKPVEQVVTGAIRDDHGRLLPGSRLNPEGARISHAAVVRAELHALLDEPSTDAKGKRTKLRQFLDVMFERATKGDMAAAKLIMDRILPATLKADINVSGMSSVQALDVFTVMASDYANQGRLPDLSHRS